jgi:hypothetical protein
VVGAAVAVAVVTGAVVPRNDAWARNVFAAPLVPTYHEESPAPPPCWMRLPVALETPFHLCRHHTVMALVGLFQGGPELPMSQIDVATVDCATTLAPSLAHPGVPVATARAPVKNSCGLPAFSHRGSRTDRPVHSCG